MTSKNPGNGGKKADITRQHILLAAARLFGEQGFTETSLREVAKNAQLKAGSVYYHFESKEQIVEEILNTGIAHIKREVESTLADLPPGATFRQRFHAAASAHLRIMLDESDDASAYIRVYTTLPPVMKLRSRSMRQHYSQIWLDLLSEAQRQGEIAPDLNLALLMPFILGGLNRSIEWYNASRGSITELATLVTQLVCDGIHTPAAKHKVAKVSG